MADTENAVLCNATVVGVLVIYLLTAPTMLEEEEGSLVLTYIVIEIETLYLDSLTQTLPLFTQALTRKYLRLTPNH